MCVCKTFIIALNMGLNAFAKQYGTNGSETKPKCPEDIEFVNVSLLFTYAHQRLRRTPPVITYWIMA